MNRLQICIKKVKPNVPLISAIASVVLNTLSVGLFIKTTVSATKTMEDIPEEERSAKRVVKEVLPKFITPSLIFVAGQALTVTSAVLGRKENMALAAALASADYRRRQFQNKTVQIYGDDAVEKVNEQLAIDAYHARQERLEEFDNEKFEEYSVSIPGSKTVLFYDAFRESRGVSGCGDGYFEVTMTKFLQARYVLNERFAHSGNVSLNDFYSALGIKGTEYGANAYWDASDGIDWIQIDLRETVIDEDLSCYILCYAIEPEVWFGSKDELDDW